MSDAQLGPWTNISSVPQVDMNWATTTREPQGELDRSAFLQLLITQLRYQDPLNPMEDRDFIAQMAQFSALEQMMNLNHTFERTQAFGMVGKVIDARFFNPVSEEWVEIEGMVTSVIVNGGQIFLVVPDESGNPVDVPFDAIREVGEAFMLPQMLDQIFSHVQGHRATDLIGQYVQALTINGDRIDFVEGRVDSVKMNGNQAILVVGGREIFFPHEVAAVMHADARRLIGSRYFYSGVDGTHLGSVRGVDIRNNRAYIVFEGGDRVPIQRINYAMDALALIGQEMRHENVAGTAESIVMRGGLPFMRVRTADDNIREIQLLEFLVARAEGTSRSGPGAATDRTEEDDDDTGNTDTPDTTPPDDDDDTGVGQ